MQTCESLDISSRIDLLSGAGLVLSNGVSARGSCTRIDETALAAGTYFLRITEAFQTMRRGFPYCINVRQR
jgi:hypothetical protein